ncbi:hypothetical protein C8F01DRAFT_1085062 [Mycena amicta]|nr:hypothetical protein C8F01DRAFT_1085062 [Mycena amicta]
MDYGPCNSASETRLPPTPNVLVISRRRGRRINRRSQPSLCIRPRKLTNTILESGLGGGGWEAADWEATVCPKNGEADEEGRRVASTPRNAKKLGDVRWTGFIIRKSARVFRDDWLLLEDAHYKASYLSIVSKGSVDRRRARNLDVSFSSALGTSILTATLSYRCWRGERELAKTSSESQRCEDIPISSGLTVFFERLGQRFGRILTVENGQLRVDKLSTQNLGVDGPVKRLDSGEVFDGNNLEEGHGGGKRQARHLPSATKTLDLGFDSRLDQILRVGRACWLPRLGSKDVPASFVRDANPSCEVSFLALLVHQTSTKTLQISQQSTGWCLLYVRVNIADCCLNSATPARVLNWNSSYVAMWHLGSRLAQEFQETRVNDVVFAGLSGVRFSKRVDPRGYQRSIQGLALTQASASVATVQVDCVTPNLQSKYPFTAPYMLVLAPGLPSGSHYDHRLTEHKGARLSAKTG